MKRRERNVLTALTIGARINFLLYNLSLTSSTLSILSKSPFSVDGRRFQNFGNLGNFIFIEIFSLEDGDEGIRY